jgi:hypothetical protein
MSSFPAQVLCPTSPNVRGLVKNHVRLGDITLNADLGEKDLYRSFEVSVRVYNTVWMFSS